MTFAGNADRKFKISDDEGWLKGEIRSVSLSYEGLVNYRAACGLRLPVLLLMTNSSSQRGSWKWFQFAKASQILAFHCFFLSMCLFSSLA